MEKLSLADALAVERGIAVTQLEDMVRELDERLADMEFRLADSEKTRRKLHNTVLVRVAGKRCFLGTLLCDL